jgi:beta-phosphoglucomutase-like phosphatase (HAD superfamily)
VEEYLSAVRETSSKWESGYELGLKPKTTDSPRDDTSPPYTVIPGVSQWLQSLMDVEMPCGLISYLEREQVDVLLDQTGLAKFFPVDKRVTASNGYKIESQQMLGASLRVERRPDHCVVFDSSPESSIAAHDVDMKSVCIVGVYPMYELLSADSTARYLDELTAMNVRRLFGERVYDQPMVESIEERPDFRRQPTTKTRFWEEGDRE